MDVSGQFHTLTTLHPGKESQTPTEYEVGWVSELFWVFWRRGKSLVPTWNQTQGRLDQSLLTVPTELL